MVFWLREYRWLWLTGVTILLLGFAYRQSLAYLVEVWATDETYGHGFFVPVISLYLVWLRRSRLEEAALAGAWWGLPVLVAGLALYFVGEFATLYVAQHLSLWLVVVGLLLAAIGPAGVRAIAFPVAYLLTMIPLPQFLYQSLSSQLQLLSSAFGVGCLQLVGITAFREGNVIDLGSIQLQVVEACSGLRYLFPLASLALLCAYLFNAPLWKRVLLFLSSLPVAVLLNGLRIGMIGVLVEYWGRGAAEGFFHAFEGWLIFVASLLVLMGEMWLLARVGRGADRAAPSLFGWSEQVSTGPVETPVAAPPSLLRLSPAYLVCAGLLVPASAVSTQIISRDETPAPRQSFVDFPMQLGTWSGRPLILEKQYVDVLKFDDYLLADYAAPEGGPVNLYVAYYRSQKKGESAHSPRSCIPGGGWEITSLDRITVETVPSQALSANRAVIQKGEERQVVWYWFQQRGRVLTNEYLVKAYLFWDALTQGRTDGALVRLTVQVHPGESEPAADQRLASLTAALWPELVRFVPD
jgi:exosortase D (VPLPA-CTERM-specific)